MEQKRWTQRPQSERKHIFAVDGAPDFLELVRALFEFEQYNVTTTNYVVTTFAQITASTPDLIIVDLVIGEREGWELLALLHEDHRTLSIPIILTSTDPKLLEQALTNVERYGTHRIVVKPFDIDDIMQTVLDLIGPA